MRHLENEEEIAPRIPMVGVAFAAVAVALLVGALAVLASRTWTQGAQTVNGAGVGGSSVEARLLESFQAKTLAETKAQEAVTSALAEEALSEFAGRVEEARLLLERASGSFEEWHVLVDALHSSEAGRRVAASPERVQQFRAIVDRRGRPTERHVQALLPRLAALDDQLAKLLEADPVVLPEESREQLDETTAARLADAEELAHRIGQDLADVEALVALAGSLAPAPQTLEEALQELRGREAQERAELIAQEVGEVRERQNELDSAMEARLAQDIREADRRQREAALADEAQQKNTEAELAERESQERDLKTRAQDPAVLAIYEPFLGLGKTQPWNSAPSNNDHCNWRVDKEALEKQPVSMYYLRKSGALDRFPTFVAFATSASEEKNDRGAWPPHGGNEETIAEYRERWEEFKSLAEIWVEMGKLKK